MTNKQKIKILKEMKYYLEVNSPQMAFFCYAYNERSGVLHAMP